MNTVTELENYIKKLDNLYLYGAGQRAKRFIHSFQVMGFAVDGCIVSERGGNPRELEGVPVYAVDELEGWGQRTADLNLLISMAGSMEDWLPLLQKLPVFRSTLFLTQKLCADVWNKWQVKHDYEKRQSSYFLDTAYPKAELGMGILVDRNTKEALMRVPYYLGMRMLEALLQSGTRENFEKEFGPLNLLPNVSVSGLTPEAAARETVQIYVACSHLDKLQLSENLPEGYVPLQVGAALTKLRKGCQTDDAGEHISDKNRDYCECTGLYWIWKNTSGQRYVGLSHYRRRLMLDDRALRFIREQDIDIVPTLPQYEIVTIKEFFEGFIETCDWRLLKKFVSEYDGEYAEYFEKYETGHFYFPCNVMLWKREWFDRYCEFAFSVAEKIEQVYKGLGVFREDRYMGYLFEQLSSLFIMRHRRELKVACAEMEWLQ